MRSTHLRLRTAATSWSMVRTRVTATLARSQRMPKSATHSSEANRCYHPANTTTGESHVHTLAHHAPQRAPHRRGCDRGAVRRHDAGFRPDRADQDLGPCVAYRIGL